MKIFQYKYIHFWVSIALFIACLFFPAFYTTQVGKQPVAWDSIPLLLFGWLGALFNNFSWYANLFYLVALIKIKNLSISSPLGFIALALALLLLTKQEMPSNTWTETVPITRYGWGYFLWLASFAVFWLGQSQLLLNKSK